MRRSLQVVAVALLALAACNRGDAPQELARDTAALGFTSDRISVVTRGSGKDIILIPGLGSHRSVWDSIAGPLEAEYRLHVVQVNGFAGTPAAGNADGPVSAPVAEELARYITANQLNKPAVVGHSMGGSIGMMLAARHPELVGQLMVVDMPAYLGEMFMGPSITPEQARQIGDSMHRRMLANPDSFVQSFSQMVSGMTNREALREGLVQNVHASDKRTVVNAFHELIVTDLRPELPRITASPLVVLYVIPPNPPIPPAQYEEAQRRSYASAPNAQIKRIDGAYHFIQLDTPARLVEEIKALTPPS